MYLHKISSLVLITSLVISGLTMLFAFPAVSAAQTSPGAVVACTTIDGAVEYTLPPGEGTVSTDEQLSLELQLQNTSSFTYPGIRVGIALFNSADATIPAYWVLDEAVHQIPPEQTRIATIEASVASVPAGTYQAVPFVGQGDDLHLLGIAMRNGADGDGFELVRTGAVSQPISYSVVVNEGTITENSVVDQPQFIEILATTENPADVPLTNTEVVIGIIQGDIPLGDAVRAQRTDGVRLIPGAERETTVADVSPEGGDYSIVSGIKRVDAFGPVDVFNFRIGTEEVPNQSWPYLSRAAISEGNEVVACVDYIGAYEGAVDLLDAVAVELTLTDAESETVLQSTATNEGEGVGTAFQFAVGGPLTDTNLTLTLATERFPLNFSETSDVPDAEERPETELYPVQNLSVDVVCDEEGGCAGGEEDSPQAVGNFTPLQKGNQFWFFAGVILAAALLMYIVLRRLHPEEPVKPKTEAGEDMHLPE